MGALKDSAFTGNKDSGNPYAGGMQIGIDYDRLEINRSVVEQRESTPTISTPYRFGSRRLVRHIGKCGRILDMGCGTGISTLEALRTSATYVDGLDVSDGMLQIARYKFHQRQGDDILRSVSDAELLDYWLRFRKETKLHKNRVRFFLDDIQTTNLFEEESFEAAIANQSVHWTDINMVFRQLYRFLKHRKPLVWTTASHFYDDPEFPSSEYGFRYNDFLKFVLDEVCKSVSVSDYKTASRPHHNFESIRATTLAHGFLTNQVETYLQPIDLAVFISCYLSKIVKELCQQNIGEEELTAVINYAVQRAVANPKALRDDKHKYEIVPIFKSTKQ